MRHSRSEVGDAARSGSAHFDESENVRVGLLGEAQVARGNEDVAHREHAESTELLGRVEDGRRESRGHLGVESDLDSRCRVVSSDWERGRDVL